MDLLDPIIREEYVNHILTILPPNRRNIPHEFLDEFIAKITEAELNKDRRAIQLDKNKL